MEITVRKFGEKDLQAQGWAGVNKHIIALSGNRGNIGITVEIRHGQTEKGEALDLERAIRENFGIDANLVRDGW